MVNYTDQGSHIIISRLRCNLVSGIVLIEANSADTDEMRHFIGVFIVC